MFRYLFQADYLASELSNNSATNSINHHHASAFRAKHHQKSSSGDNNSINQQESIAGTCQWLYELLISENRTTSSLKSFVDFELFVKHHYANPQQQQQDVINKSSTIVGSNTQSSTYSDKLTISNNHHNDNTPAFSSSPSNSYLQPSSFSSYPLINQEQDINSKLATEDSLLGNNSQILQLQDCFHQLQLEEYYSQYDIYIGLRIASTLTILFIIFILFVIYKTGCRNNSNSNGRTSRSQLQLTSSASSQSKAQSFRYYN